MTQAADHSAYLRGGVVELLRAEPVLADAMGAAIYGRKVPAKHPWPFIRVETPTTAAFETSGVVGGTTDFTVHVFAKGETAAEDVDRYVRAVIRAIDGQKPPLALDDGETGEVPHVVECDFVRVNVMRDSDEADAYHGAVDFAATTAVSR
jgi:hypothetical protein